MKSYLSIALAVLFCTGLFVTECQAQRVQKPVVKTKAGDVSGKDSKGVYAFLGIPYAKAERFMPPHAPDKWTGVRSCVEFGPVARQNAPWYPDSVQNEKTLFNLNVWTQGVNDGKKRPVLVWYHGGGFNTGASNDPMTYGEAMVKKGDIVFVSVNHRLNILGFLDLSACGERYAQSANVGVLDLVKSLEWVKQNIEAFGGNPNDVTIVGESGGGGKVGTLMCMPAAKGLFHKAIIQSGTLINTMTREQSQKLGLDVIKNLGLTPAEVNKLNDVSYADLVRAGNSAVNAMFGQRRPGSPTMNGFAPSVDGVVLLQQPFTPGFADISANIPVLMGSTLNELTNVAYGNKNLTLEQAKSRLASQFGDKTDEFIKQYAKAYPDYTPQDLLSIDQTFRPFTIRTADAHSKASKAPLYIYLLTWKSQVDNASKGSFHGVDIPLAFYTVDLRQDWTGNTQDAWALSEKMSAAWLNFIKTGNPNVQGVLPTWEPYTEKNGATMIFDNTCKIVNNHDRALMQLVKPL